MKLQTKLALAFAGTIGVAALAGCPGMPGSTNPTPTPANPTPTPSPTATPTIQRVIIQRVVFDPSGDHAMYIKNTTNASVNLGNYWVSFQPLAAPDAGEEATASIVNINGSRNIDLSAGGSLRVLLRDVNLNNFTNAVEAPFQNSSGDTLSTPVQYGAGGGLTLFKATAATAANVSDFVQWGRNGTTHEAKAQEAKLWTVGTNVATVSLGTGATMSVKTEAATGSVNWTF